MLEDNVVVVGQRTLCGTVAVNGVFVRPAVVMFLISTPGNSPWLLDPAEAHEHVLSRIQRSEIYGDRSEIGINGVESGVSRPAGQDASGSCS